MVSTLWKIIFGIFTIITIVAVILIFSLLLIVNGNNKTRQSIYEVKKEEESLEIPVQFFACMGIFFCIFIILGAAVVVLSFYGGSIAQNEVCRHSHSNGLSQLSSIVDRYVAAHWDYWTRSLKIDLNGIQLRLKKPQGILKALTGPCVNDSKRLLQAVGFTDIINVTEIINSPLLTSMLSKGKNISKE